MFQRVTYVAAREIQMPMYTESTSCRILGKAVNKMVELYLSRLADAPRPWNNRSIKDVCVVLLGHHIHRRRISVNISCLWAASTTPFLRDVALLLGPYPFRSIRRSTERESRHVGLSRRPPGFPASAQLFPVHFTTYIMDDTDDDEDSDDSDNIDDKIDVGDSKVEQSV